MKYEGGTNLKKPRLIRVKIMVYCCKIFTKERIEYFSFQVFNKRIILINKECMVLVCYPWMSQEFYLITFQLFQRFFIIILKKQIKFISVAVRGIFRILYKSCFEAWVGYFVDMLRPIQEQIKYYAFTRQKAIVIKETWIT